MRINIKFVVLAVVLLVMAVVVWRVASKSPVRPDQLEARLEGTFREYGLNEKTVVSRTIVEKRRGRKTYFRLYSDYDVPSSFSWKRFQSSINKVLKRSGYRVTKFDQRYGAAYDLYSITVNRGDLNVMELKIRRSKAVEKAAKVRVKKPAPAPKPKKRAKIAIVIDDFGYNMNNVEAFLDINEPLTLSILPDQPYSARVARLAKSRGYEVILHLPLESKRAHVAEEAVTIRSGMSAGEIEDLIDEELADVPGADGVSNHQGSKSTEDAELMTDILRCLKKRDLFFFDSLTSPKSVCRGVASDVGVKFARRDRFLDNVNDVEAIEKQLASLERLAFRYGKATAICHDRKNTAIALENMMPKMAEDGIEFVYISDFVN